VTAFSGITGALFALAYSSAEKAGDVTCWILPFTSGGFLYIALSNIIPELMTETKPRESLKQIVSIYLGILVIYVLKVLFD
jgi:zinc transporter 13